MKVKHITLGMYLTLTDTGPIIEKQNKKIGIHKYVRWIMRVAKKDTLGVYCYQYNPRTNHLSINREFSETKTYETFFINDYILAKLKSIRKATKKEIKLFKENAEPILVIDKL